MHKFYRQQRIEPCEVLLLEPPAPHKKGVVRILGSIGTYKTSMAWPPLDLMIIDGLLSKEKIKSFIYDANGTNGTWRDVEEIAKLTKPYLAIFTTSTTTILHDLNTARIIKRVSPSTITAAIGTHTVALPEETLRNAPDLDSVIIDEPEMIILDLIRNDFSFKDTAGICYRRDGNLYKNPAQEKLKDLDFLGFPSHHKLPRSIYHDPLTEHLPMTITYGSRGCINSCIYCCSKFYQPLRLRSVEKIIEELKWIEDLGIKEVRFFDLGLTNDLNWAKKLFNEMIRNKIKLTWSCEARVDRINPEIVKLMRTARCRSIDIGVETADREILKTIKKNITLEQVFEAVNIIKKEKIKVMTHFILGLPGETKETVRKTLDFVLKLNPDYMALGIATPHPGTFFYDFLEKNNYLKTKDWSKYDPLQEPVYDYPEISGKEIYKALSYIYRRFYLRPEYISKRII
ncbi:MAG: B12-binding domain-containing radical SAM protein, partial [Candidatus Omnitrophota bacterium]